MRLHESLGKILILTALAFTLFTGNNITAQVYKKVHVETPGTLSSLITYSEQNTVTNLTVTGNLNADDYSVFRNMYSMTEIDLDSVQTEGDSIARWAFNNNLISVILPSSLTKIGIYAFAGFSNMISVTIPSTVSTIGSYAFAGCSGLTSLALPSSLKFIDKWTFVSCTSLESILLPNSIDSIGMYAFAGCTSLTSITIPSSVFSVGYDAFVGCTSLTDVNIFSSLSQSSIIKKYAFAGCPNLAAVVFHPSAGIVIEDGAFVSDPALTTLIFDSPSVTSIGKYAFASCQNLTSLVLPNSLVSIEETAFASCPGLTSLYIPSSVTTIGRAAFGGCSGLTSITIPSSVDTMGVDAFSGCSNLDTIRVNAPNPLEFPAGIEVFYGVNKDSCILYVPAGSKDAYQAAYVWRDFINIVEFDFQLNISPDTLFMADTTGSTAVFEIISNAEWHVKSDQNWLSVKDTTGMDNGVINLKAEDNPSLLKRYATVNITGLGFAPQSVFITQDPKPAFSVSSDTLNIGAFEGSQVLLTIYSNTDWIVNSNNEWLAINTILGNGDSAITITADANPNTVSREASLTISADRVNSQIITIFQEPKPALSVSSDSLDIETDAGSTQWLGVISNTNWTANADQDWLVIDPSSGSGDDSVTFMASANPLNVIREAVITFTADSVPSVTVIVTQEAGIINGISEVDPLTVNVYPNPAKHILYIDGAEGNVLEIYNAQGQLILSQCLKTDHESADVSSLTSGVYVIHIGNKSWKIIK